MSLHLWSINQEDSWNLFIKGTRIERSFLGIAPRHLRQSEEIIVPDGPLDVFLTMCCFLTSALTWLFLGTRQVKLYRFITFALTRLSHWTVQTASVFFALFRRLSSPKRHPSFAPLSLSTFGVFFHSPRTKLKIKPLQHRLWYTAGPAVEWAEARKDEKTW